MLHAGSANNVNKITRRIHTYAAASPMHIPKDNVFLPICKVAQSIRRTYNADDDYIKCLVLENKIISSNTYVD